MDRKRTEQLLTYLREFQLKDMIGFSKLVGAEEQPEFEDFVVEIATKYNELSRKQRRDLLKFAKNVCLANRDMAKGGIVWRDQVKRVVDDGT